MDPTAPILIMHGTDDWRASPKNALRMAEGLLAQRHPFRLAIFEGGDHSLADFRDEEMSHTRAWFDRYVRDGKPWPRHDTTVR